MQDRSGSRDGKRPSVQAATIQRQQAIVLAERAVGVIQSENPVVQRGAQSGKAGSRLCRQYLSNIQAFERSANFARVEFSGSEFAGRDIHVRDSGVGAIAANSGKVIIFVGS